MGLFKTFCEIMDISESERLLAAERLYAFEEKMSDAWKMRSASLNAVRRRYLTLRRTIWRNRP